MSTPLAYRLRVRDLTDTADALTVTSLASGTNPYIAEPPTGDGQTLSAVDGKVTVGAYTVKVLDATGSLSYTAEVFRQDFGDYADTAAMLAEWTVTDPQSIGTVTLQSTYSRTSTGKALSVAFTGLAPSSVPYGVQVAKALTGLTPLATYTFSADVYSLGPDGGGVGFWQDVPYIAALSNISKTVTADASGNATVYVAPGVSAGAPTVTLIFDNLRLVESVTTSSRLVTGSLADATGRQQLLSRKAIVEESTNAGADWTNLTTGYVNQIQLTDALTYEFTVGESKRIEQSTRLWDRMSPPTLADGTPSPYLGVLDRMSCIIGGPIVGDFGPTQDRGRPLFEVTSVAAETVDGITRQRVGLEWVNGFLYHGAFHEGDKPIDDQNVAWFNDIAREYVATDSARFVAGGGTSGVQAAPCPNLVVRLYDADDATWVTDQTPRATRLLQSITDLSVDWSVVDTAGRIFLDDWQATDAVLPSVGDRFRLALFPKETSARNPIHLSGHPVDLYTQSAASKGISYNADSAATVKAALGDLYVDLRITEGGPFEDMVTQHLFAPFGFTVRGNASGERELITTRVRPTAVPTTVVTVDELVSDEGTAFDLNESNAAIQVTLETKNFVFTDDRASDTAIDSIVTSTVTLELVPDDPVTIFGTREIRYQIPGAIRGLSTGTAARPGTLDLWARDQFSPLFDWLGRGEITGEIHVRRDVVSELVGDEIVLNLAHNPTASSSQTPPAQRGTVQRRVQILRRTEAPEGPVLLVFDRGPATVDDDVPPFDFPTCGDITAPSGLGVLTAGVTAVASWTNGDATLAVEVSVRVATATEPIIVQVLPPGSTTTTLTLPDASTAYIVGVRHVEAPPNHCTSDYAEQSTTSEAAPTLTPPIDPVAFADGAGRYGMDSTATVFDASVEVWEALETAVGSGVAGTYVLPANGTLASVADGPTRWTTAVPAPNDGLLRFMKARHVKTGWTASDFTAEVSINPWLLIPPTDPTDPGDPPLGVTEVPVKLPLLGSTLPLLLAGVPADRTALDDAGATQTQFPLGPFVAGRLVVVVTATALPAGASVAAEFENPAVADDWHPLQDPANGDGPTLAVDATSVGTDLGTARIGDWVTLRPEARQDVRLRAVILGGDDDAAKLLGLARVDLDLTAQDLGSLPPLEIDDPVPPEFDPGSCDTPGALDSFAYADVAALSVAWAVD